MSYARKLEVSSDAFKAIVDSIIHSPKHNGFSICAAEWLMAAVMNCKPDNCYVKMPKTDYVEKLKGFPVDYWEFVRRRHSRSNEYDLQHAAKRRLARLANQDNKLYLTFEGETFQVSSLNLAGRYLNSIIPAAAWDSQHSITFIRKAMEHSIKVVMVYGENQATLEFKK